MTLQDVHTSTNGAATTSKPKRKIATSSVDGAILTVKFSDSYNSQVLTLDAAKLPAALQPSLVALGAAGLIQAAYSVADKPVEAAQKMIDRLMKGDWTPGRAATAEPDELVVALADHLKESHEYVEQTYLPGYAAKHGLASVGAARRKLRAHPTIAAKVAEITAERAKAALAAAKKTPSDSLAL